MKVEKSISKSRQRSIHESSSRSCQGEGVEETVKKNASVEEDLALDEEENEKIESIGGKISEERLQLLLLRLRKIL